jgi:hypothetical protein
MSVQLELDYFLLTDLYMEQYCCWKYMHGQWLTFWGTIVRISSSYEFRYVSNKKKNHIYIYKQTWHALPAIIRGHIIGWFTKAYSQEILMNSYIPYMYHSKMAYVTVE